jgi:hypothetical protein
MENFDLKKYLAESKITEKELNEITPTGIGRKAAEGYGTTIADIFEKDLFPKYGYDRTDGYVGVKAKRAGMSKEDYIKDSKQFVVNIVLGIVKNKLGIN